MAAENFDLEVIDLDDGPLLDDKEPLISDGNGTVSRSQDPTVSNSPTDPRCCSCLVNDNPLAVVTPKLRSYFSAQCCASSALRFFPFVRIMMGYNWRKNVMPDIIAGLTVGIMNIPQGMAYAMLAELDPVVGLYVSFFSPVLYFIFGTSLQMSVGTFALASLMLADPVNRLAGDKVDPRLLGGANLTMEATDRNLTHHQLMAEKRWEVALSVTLLVGLMQIGMGILQLGFLAVFLSDALVSGFTTGAAIHVFTSQLPAVFGVRITRHHGIYRLIKTYSSLFVAIPHANLVTLGVSGVSLVVLVVVRIFVNPPVMRRIKFPIPIELLLVIVGTVCSYFLRLDAHWSVQVIGTIPSGFPSPRVPRFHIMSQVMLDAGTIAVFMFACSVSLAKIFSRKHRYPLDANQEAFAMGLTNAIVPFFGAYLAAGSLSRSMVQDEMGGKSQLAGLISAFLILIVLLAIGPFLSSVPNCILSCIILISLKGLFKQFAELPKLWRMSKYDFAIWLITFACTLLLDVGLGLLAGLAFSLLTVVMRAHALSATLVQESVPDTSSPHLPIALPPGTRLIRLVGPLYFGSAEKLRTTSLALTGLRSSLQTGTVLNHAGEEERTEATRRLIFDCSRVTFVDSTGLRIMEEMAEDLDLVGVELTVVDGEKQLFNGLSASRSDNITLSLSLDESIRRAGRHYSLHRDENSDSTHSAAFVAHNSTSVDDPLPVVTTGNSVSAGQPNQDDFDVVT